jgi:hypothetical protein
LVTLLCNPSTRAECSPLFPTAANIIISPPALLDLSGLVRISHGVTPAKGPRDVGREYIRTGFSLMSTDRREFLPFYLRSRERERDRDRDRRRLPPPLLLPYFDEEEEEDEGGRRTGLGDRRR